MKKTITFTSIVLSALTASAQLPVSHTAGNKNVLIEEFTGIHCQYCPDGHKISAQVMAAYPGKVFAVNVHTGGYASPGSGELDFRTTDGDAISNIPGMGITGYPTGDVNRHLWYGSALAIDRANWQLASQMAMSQSAYVNIAGAAVLNTATKVLTINIEAYYTANSPLATNKFTVLLLQDNIDGTQTGGSTFNPTMINSDGTYRHMHALRDVLTSAAAGDIIATTSAGTTFTKTITYTVPASFKNIPVKTADLELIAFVSEGSTETINVCKIPITLSTTGIAENTLNSSLNIYPNPAKENMFVEFNLDQAQPQPVAINVYNSLGEIVYTETLQTVSSGPQQVKIETGKLAQGLYILEVKTKDASSLRRVVME